MKKLIIAIAATAALLGTRAVAADSEVKAPPSAPLPVYSWAGLYIGGTVGGAWVHSDLNSQFYCGSTHLSLYVPTCPYEYPADLTAISSAGTGRLTATGLVIGGQAGYNWQAGAFVYGIEVDLNSIPLSSSQTVRGFLPDNRWFLVGTNTDTHWLLTSSVAWVGLQHHRFYFMQPAASQRPT